MVTKKWQDNDLVWPHSDIDLRIIVDEPPADWISFNEQLAQLQRELVTADPILRRVLEHPPGWVFLRREVDAGLVPAAEMATLSHSFGDHAAVDQWRKEALARPWSAEDDRFYRGIIAARADGAYRLEADSADNVVLDADRYAAHCVSWHYLAPVVFASASLHACRRLSGKTEALHAYPIATVTEFLSLARNGYRAAPTPAALLRQARRAITALPTLPVPAPSTDGTPTRAEVASAVGALRCRIGRYSYYLAPPPLAATGYLIDRETKDLHGAIRTLRAACPTLPTPLRTLTESFLELVPPPPTTPRSLRQFLDNAAAEPDVAPEGDTVSVALGVNFHHDTAACLIVDGRIIAAEEERWSGVKHNRTRREDYLSAPDQALRYCLDTAGVTPAEVDTVWAASMAPTSATGAWASTEHAHLARLLPAPLGERLRLLSHHTAHVLSAFPLAGVDRAAGLVIDAGGSALGADLAGRERISGYHLTWSGWERVHHALPSYEPATAGHLVRRTHSLGHLYRNLAVRCIPPGDEPEGSMMALAALGDPHRYRDHLRALVHLGDDGHVRIHPPLGSYDLDTPISPGGQAWSRDTATAKSMQHRADLAAAAQELFEDAVVHVATHLHRITGSDTLVFAGGCALNTRLNATLAERSGFATLFVPPAPHDAGTALGAALYGWCFTLAQTPPPAPIDAAWGPHPGTLDTAALRTAGHHVTTGFARDEVIHRVASLLADQRVVGWVQGGMEFGPRALGHRSILAHPGSRQVRDRVNRLKQRASYRPLAPAVLAEHAPRYFHGAVDAFMNRTALVRPEHRERLAAVTHVDGSARVQAVAADHGAFRDLLEAFAQRSGIPVLLNTSFNLKGHPIIRTARQAVDAFAALDLDALAVADTLIVRAGIPAEPRTLSAL